MITLHIDGEPPEILLDLTDVTTERGAEDGLLSMALDPEFDDFPFLYIYHSVRRDLVDPDKLVSNERAYPHGHHNITRLSRYRVKDGRPLPDEELAILDVPQPAGTHNGGAVRFGPDGMLYLGLGDGGHHDGPLQAQRTDTLLGSIVRIDVRGASESSPYSVPADNPKIDAAGALPEIYAYGLRNPWRMAFDAVDGTLWVADVGYLDWEEINIAAPGANYGWGLFEADMCRASESRCGALDAVAPVFSYARGAENGCAVIGGAVYRGTAMPWLRGAYIFGDYCSSRVWALTKDADAVADGGGSGWRMRELTRLEPRRPIVSFGVDADGEIYVAAFNSPILKLVEAPPDVAASADEGPAR